MMHGHYAIYRLLILIPWLAFVLFWAVSALSAKKVVSRVESRWRFMVGVLVPVAIVILVPRPIRAAFIPHSHAIQIAGVTLTFLGVAFAIWARMHIGRNWSGVPSVQEEHQLVTSGPYSMVRHPIYTGVLVALFGSALVAGLVGISIFITSAITVLWRIRVEEKIMLDLFPQQYPEYKKRTKALIPFVW